MSPSPIDEREKNPPRETPAFPLQNDKNLPSLCGPGCACGAKGKTGKWRIAIMLPVIAVVVISLIYKELI